jgi:hypothetical protein
MPASITFIILRPSVRYPQTLDTKYTQVQDFQFFSNGTKLYLSQQWKDPDCVLWKGSAFKMKDVTEGGWTKDSKKLHN